MKKSTQSPQEINYIFLLLSTLLLLLNVTKSQAQTTVRYQKVIQGGTAMIGNAHYLKSTDFGGTAIENDVDSDPSTDISSSSDLILPVGSVIQYAHLSVETGFEVTPGDMTSVKFQVPGSGYVTLTNASSEFLVARSVQDPGTRKYRQMIFDVTNLLPSNGYVSTAGGGASGRYYIADPLPVRPVTERSNMGGWSLIVVYKNSNSLVRSIIVADNWQFFGGGVSTVITDLPNVQLPNGGTVQATIGLAGTYGDPANAGYGCSGCTDYVRFGISGAGLTDLTDPVSGRTDDALSSTIGWAVDNDVTTDGGPAISGSYTAKNPATGFTPANYAPPGSYASADYDSDIFSASGILAADGSVQSIRLEQETTGNDWLVAGTYFISIEVTAVKLGKSIFPSSIPDGGIATYTFTLDNTDADSVDLTGVSFTDNLPSGIEIAGTPNVTNSCGGTIVATAGDNSIAVSGVNINSGDTCTITVDITNAFGQTNLSCATNPVAFTNSTSNISNTTDTLVPNFDPVCLEVIPSSTIDFDGVDDFINRTAFLGNHSEASMMSWINLDSSFDGGEVMGQRNFRIFIDSNKRLKVFVKTDSGGTSSVVTPNSGAPVLITDEWCHVAATYDGDNGTINLYLNGELEWTYTGLSGTKINNQDAWNSHHDFEIGRNTELNNDYFEGAIYESRVYNKTLKDDQLQKQVYQEIENNAGNVRGSVIPKDIGGLLWTDLELYYKMESINSGMTLDDCNLGIDGKLNRMTTYQERSAPMPYIADNNGVWSNHLTWERGDVWDIEDLPNKDWAIVKITNNATITTTSNHTNLGLIIDSGSELLVNNDSGIINTWYVKLDGKIDLVGESQLVQEAYSDLDITSVGFLERDQQGKGDIYSYNFWSSPVNPINSTANNTDYTVAQVLKDGTNANNPQSITWVSGYNGAPTTPITLSNYWIWMFDNQVEDYGSWQHVLQSGSIRVGLGYTMKGSGSGSTSNTQNYTFVGKPNNGDISHPLTTANTSLLGNPYPSAIDADQFILDNIGVIDEDGDAIHAGVTTGALYFWEHFATNNSHVLAEYHGGYATYNLSGATMAIPDPMVSSNGTGSVLPKRYIPVGQGFFVEGGEGGTVTFNNGQRVFQKESGGNSVFTRTSETTTNTDSNVSPPRADINRMYFNVSLPDGPQRQLLLAVKEGTTLEVNFGYDAKLLDVNPIDIAWSLADDTYVIQTIGEITEDLEIPLHVKSASEGIGYFSIEELQGIDPEIEIYFVDKQENIYTDLREGAVAFNLEAGEFSDRYSIVFRIIEEVLDIEEVKEDSDDLVVFYNSSTRSIDISNTSAFTAKNITLYNVLGQTVLNIKEEYTYVKSISVPVNVATGTYMVRFNYNQGTMLAKKVMIK